MICFAGHRPGTAMPATDKTAHVFGSLANIGCDITMLGRGRGWALISNTKATGVYDGRRLEIY